MLVSDGPRATSVAVCCQDRSLRSVKSLQRSGPLSQPYRTRVMDSIENNIFLQTDLSFGVPIIAAAELATDRCLQKCDRALEFTAHFRIHADDVLEVSRYSNWRAVFGETWNRLEPSNQITDHDLSLHSSKRAVGSLSAR